MNKKGFTLIELLVVIAIIGLLSTLAVVSLNNARAKSRDAKRIADVKQIQTALELYYNDNNGYPVLGAEASIQGSTTLMPNFMVTIPTAPSPADGTCAATGANSNQYWYQSETNAGAACAAADCASYKLNFCLGAATGELAAGSHCATPSGITSAACVFP